MTEPIRVSAAADLPTPADDGTPAGLPTPAGEPAQKTLPLKIARPVRKSATRKPSPVAMEGKAATKPSLAPPEPAKTPFHAIGALVMGWGVLEATTIDKLVAMRRSFGDVRAVGGRSRPTLQRLLAELRALVAMRDRHDKQVLTLIAALDGDLQRLVQFRNMVVDGARQIEGDEVVCHDIKNVEHRVAVRTVRSETQRIEAITAQIAGL